MTHSSSVVRELLGKGEISTLTQPARLVTPIKVIGYASGCYETPTVRENWVLQFWFRATAFKKTH